MSELYTFQYRSDSLSGAAARICEVDAISHVNAHEVDILLRKSRECARLPAPDITDREIACLLQYVAENNETKSVSEIETLALRRNSTALRKRAFQIWQDYYEKAHFCSVCEDMLQEEATRVEWENQWKRLMTSDRIPTTLAGLAAFQCAQDGITPQEYRKRFRISENSELGKKLNALFYCYCNAELFLCDDTTLSALIDVLDEPERLRLLRNMLRRFPLFDSSLVLLPDHSVYLSRYRNVASRLSELSGKNPYAALLANYLAASEIPVPEHARYWEYIFLNDCLPDRRIGFFRYLHIPEKNFFLVCGGKTVLVDDYRTNTLYKLRELPLDEMNLPGDPARICSADDCYTGNRWMNVAHKIRFD